MTDSLRKASESQHPHLFKLLGKVDTLSRGVASLVLCKLCVDKKVRQYKGKQGGEKKRDQVYVISFHPLDPAVPEASPPQDFEV